MKKTNDYIVINIRRIIEDDPELGELKLKKLLSEFSCPKNPEVEDFLKYKCIEFVKKNQAVTYLLLSLKNGDLLGFFAITIKPLSINAEMFSNTIKRKLARISDINEENNTYNLSAYLIAQLGKNFNADTAVKISGEQILATAIKQVMKVQYHAGGVVTFVETQNHEKLLEFYERNGFKQFSARQTKSPNTEQHELIQLLKLL